MVSLRDVLVADLPILFEHQADPVACRRAAVMQKTVLCDRQVAGNIVSFERSNRREIGYWIGREYWGRGVATEALNRFLQHVTPRPLFAHVAKRNPASIRVLEKCGFAITERSPRPPEADENSGEKVVLTLSARHAPTQR